MVGWNIYTTQLFITIVLLQITKLIKEPYKIGKLTCNQHFKIDLYISILKLLLHGIKTRPLRYVRNGHYVTCLNDVVTLNTILYHHT